VFLFIYVFIMISSSKVLDCDKDRIRWCCFSIDGTTVYLKGKAEVKK